MPMKNSVKLTKAEQTRKAENRGKYERHRV